VYQYELTENSDSGRTSHTPISVERSELKRGYDNDIRPRVYKL